MATTMMRKGWVFLTVLTLALACCAAMAAKQDDGKKQQQQNTTVTIKKMKFSPASLKIKVGQTVTWKNSDDHDHTVKANDKSFKSGNLSKGDTFKHTFKKAGTVKYSCSYHPRMKGEIKVEK